jgi:hypothetical protein
MEEDVGPFEGEQGPAAGGGPRRGAADDALLSPVRAAMGRVRLGP